MRGRKEALWAVVISAALITAGLVLSCGDDEDGGGGGPAVNCRDACENLWECGLIPYYGPYLGFTVADCTESCEGEVEGGGEGFTELYECIADTDCDDIWRDCFCQAYCEKIDDCFSLSYWWYETVDDCVFDCEEGYSIYTIMCTLGYSSCYLIWDFCLF